MQTFPNLAQCNGSSFFSRCWFFSGHFSQCRSSVEAWRFFYIAPTSKSPTAQAHQQQLGDHCEPTLTTHYITSLATWPTQYSTYHNIAFHFNRLPMTMHYCTLQLNSLPITWLPLHRSSSSIPAIIDALYNPTPNPSLNANGNRGDSDGYVGVLKKDICNPSPLYFQIWHIYYYLEFCILAY